MSNSNESKDDLIVVKDTYSVIDWELVKEDIIKSKLIKSDYYHLRFADFLKTHYPQLNTVPILRQFYYKVSDVNLPYRKAKQDRFEQMYDEFILSGKSLVDFQKTQAHDCNLAVLKHNFRKIRFKLNEAKAVNSCSEQDNHSEQVNIVELTQEQLSLPVQQSINHTQDNETKVQAQRDTTQVNVSIANSNVYFYSASPERSCALIISYLSKMQGQQKRWN